MAALAGFVIGPPVLLYHFAGSPLPSQVPGWHQITTALTGRDEGGLILAVVRDGTWLAWLMFTACVVGEAHAAARGRRATWLRLWGMQGAAARLVALAGVAVSTVSASTPSASAAIVTGQHGSQPGGGPVQPGSRPFVVALDSLAISREQLVTVRSGDCLWSIAQRYLGAGDRYPEIARLNYGRQMADGEVFTNPALVLPGWQLLLPADGTADGAGQPAAMTAAGQHIGHATADVHYQRRHPAALVPVAMSQQGGARDETRIGEAGAAAPASSAGAAASGAASPAQADSARPDAASLARGQAHSVPQAATFGSGALAGAIVISLTRLRFRQRQERRHGRRIALPARAVALAAEQRLRATAQPNPLRRLRDALAILEYGAVASRAGLPDIVGIHLTPDVLEVLLAAPAPDAPPVPFEVTPGRQGMCWQLALPAFGPLPAGPSDCHVLPGLVSVGSTGDGHLLLDLEALQVTGCDGPNALVDQVVTTVATELATAQWSGWHELLLVGFDELAPLGRAEHCGTVAEALSIVASRSARTAQRLAERGPADIRELRISEPDDEDWGLQILVSRIEPSPDQLTRLLAMAADSRAGMAALFAGDPETSDGRTAPTVLQLAPDPLVADGIVANVVPLHITVRPHALSSAEYEAIATLFTAAADLRDGRADEEPYTGYAGPPWIRQSAAEEPDPSAVGHLSPAALDFDAARDWPGAGTEPAAPDTAAPRDWLDDGAEPGPAACDTAPDSLQHGSELASAEAGQHRVLSTEPTAQLLTVGVLGPLVISGTAGPLHPKQAELVLALALAAPAGLSNAALCDLLGADPDHPKPADAVRQIIVRTRRRLGRASDGAEFVMHTGSGRYQLHPEASLDWSRFRERAGSADAADLRIALSLVRGEPFSGGYFWWIDIPLIESVRAEVVDAAERLAEIELAAGSPRAAARAARSGLLAESSAEQLWRAVMRAEHAAGNLAGVAEAWRRCLDAIEDVAPGGEPHPDTAALYRRLSTAMPAITPSQQAAMDLR